MSEEDLRELFGAVGPLVSASLVRDYDGGRGTQRAEVIFTEIHHALEAIKRYNNVPLDDMPLRITLATGSSAALQSGGGGAPPAQERNEGGRDYPAGRRGGRGGRGNGGNVYSDRRRGARRSPPQQQHGGGGQHRN